MYGGMFRKLCKCQSSWIANSCPTVTVLSAVCRFSMSPSGGSKAGQIQSYYSDHTDDRVMQKLINKKGAKTKRKWYQPHVAEPLEPIGKKMTLVKKGQSEAQRTRAKQLSHVLYDKITQIVNTGELCQELQDKQVLITSVKMHPNFGGMNVYWDADRTDAHDIEEILFANSGKLRSLLISYHVLGRIPTITFVKSKGKGSDVSRINELLEVADYGPDYKPTQWYKATQPQNTNGEPIAQALNMDGEETETGGDTKIVGGVAENSLSTLRNDNDHLVTDLTRAYFNTEGLDFHTSLYSLPHEDLMKKVVAKKNKVKVKEEENVSQYTDISAYSERLAQMERLRMKHKSGKESTKVKQQRLQRDVHDFQSSTASMKYAFIDPSHLEEDADDGNGDDYDEKF